MQNIYGEKVREQLDNMINQCSSETPKTKNMNISNKAFAQEE